MQVLDTGLDKLHVPYSYGFSIILLTIFVKALTFPLSKKQVGAPTQRLGHAQNHYEGSQRCRCTGHGWEIKCHVIRE